jgi:hypothetical protein
MLQSNPTKKGTGIEIWGDYGDLKNLHTTIHKIGNRLDEYKPRDKGQSDIIMNFAYEVRKSFEHSRLKEKFSFDSENQVEYYGFRYLWTDLLYLISVLRFNAGYVALDELDQANLYILEHNIKKTLFEYDPKGAQQIQHFFGQRIMIHDELISLVLTAINIEFLTRTPGKKRFREIPSLLIAYSPFSDAYEMWKSDLKKEAKKLNCEPHEIRYDGFPAFEW